MHLIVGLGNPGEKYEHTRHNAGFDVITILAERAGIPVRRLKIDSLIGEGIMDGHRVTLCKPQTYMNLSGVAVGQMMRWYGLAPENLIVIYDDVDIDFGAVRIRPSGSAGSHNGMRSIIEQLGVTSFPRIRVGTGAKPPEWELADWVLSRYNTKEERRTAFDAYVKAAEAARAWVSVGIDNVMNVYNTKKKKEPEEKADV